MSIEVLLMAEVPELGSEGDVVKVADGYARNYLLPRKLAAPVTDATRRKLAKVRLDRESKRKADLDAARDMAARLDKASCTIAVKAIEGGKLYGSVAVADIAASLKTQGIEINKDSIVLDGPIKELGVYNVKVTLHPEVDATVRVWIVEE